MDITELAIPGPFVVTPKQFADDRGVFLEWFRFERFEEATGHSFTLAQANCSVSAAGVVRGIHYADVPPGQAKYVTCIAGSVIDYIIDIRVGSPTFGAWDSVLLDTRDRRAVYLPEGFGHAFVALADDSAVVYLCSEPYSPSGEHEINPLDPQIGLVFPPDITPLLSPKDLAAPSLATARESGLLPKYSDVAAYITSLRST